MGGGKWRVSLYNFTEGGKWGWRESEICTVVKVLLNVFAFPSEEMKAHVNKPFYPILSIPFPHFKAKEGSAKASVIQYRDLIIQSHLHQLDLCWTLLTTSGQDKLSENQQNYPISACTKVNKSY